VESLGTIVIRGQSGGVLVWLSAWSKEQTTLDLHINSMTYTLFFYSRLSVSKSIFYVSLGNIFTVFVEALVVKAPGQLPSLPPPRPW